MTTRLDILASSSSCFCRAGIRMVNLCACRFQSSVAESLRRIAFPETHHRGSHISRKEHLPVQGALCSLVLRTLLCAGCSISATPSQYISDPEFPLGMWSRINASLNEQPSSSSSSFCGKQNPTPVHCLFPHLFSGNVSL